MFACGERFDLVNFLPRLQFHLERLGRLGFATFLLVGLALGVRLGVAAALRAGAGRVAPAAARAQVEVAGGEAWGRGGARHRVQGKQAQLLAAVWPECKIIKLKSVSNFTKRNTDL